MQTPTNFTSKLLSSIIVSKVPFIILILSMLAGMMALNYTPREEEPQIVVPMIDVIVSTPGVNASQVELRPEIKVEDMMRTIIACGAGSGDLFESLPDRTQ